MKNKKIILTVIVCMAIIGIQAQNTKKTPQKATQNNEVLDLSKLSDALNSQEVKDLGNQISQVINNFNEQIKTTNNEKTKQYNDVILNDNGKKISLKQTLENSSKEVMVGLNQVFKAENERYKKMSYQEFKQEFEPVQFGGIKKEAVIQELYSEMKKNNGNIFKAINIVSKRHKE